MQNFKELGPFIVERVEIIGTEIVKYHAWEPSEVQGPHGTIATFDGHPGWYGAVDTLHPPECFARLPSFSEERSAAVRAWYESRYHMAKALIYAAYPETIGAEGVIDRWI